MSNYSLPMLSDMQEENIKTMHLWFNSFCFASFLWKSRQENTTPHFNSIFNSSISLHLPPPLSHLRYPLCEFCYYTVVDLFILPITALLFSPASLLLHNIFHLIAGCSAGVVESLVCWGVRCEMGSQTCNPHGFLSALHIRQWKKTKTKPSHIQEPTARRFHKCISTLHHECAVSPLCNGVVSVLQLLKN